jgi:hypothetical protein
MNKVIFYLSFTMYFFIYSLSLVSQSNYQPIHDQGLTSEAHRNNIGKIVWADRRIAFNKQDEITFLNEFNSGMPLYGRGYLPKCLYNLSIDEGNDKCLNPENEYELRIIADGADKGLFHSFYFPNQDFTTFQISLSLSTGDSEDEINQGVTAKWANFVNGLDKGKHEIIIEFYGGKKGCDQKKYSEGKFWINKTIDSKIKGAGPEVPKSLMTNKKLENEMVEAVKNQGWSNEYPIDFVIIESDWRIIRDGFGNITCREINTYGILKDRNGNCRANDISFRQPYKGKNYGKTEFYGLGLISIPVNCTDYGK